MAATALNPKLQEYNDLLVDVSRPIPEIKLTRILLDLQGMVDRVDHATAGEIFALIGACYLRLKRSDKALDAYKLALQRLREPTEMRAMVLSNRAAALLRLGRYQEAANSCIESARIPSGYEPINLANLAEALDRLGDRSAALEVFQEAIATANLANANHCFGMAYQAAELGLDLEAVELFARFIAQERKMDLGKQSAIDIIRAVRDEDDGALEDMPALRDAIRRVMAMEDEVARLASLRGETETDDKAATADAMDVYEATLGLREAALVQTNDHGQARS